MKRTLPALLLCWVLLFSVLHHVLGSCSVLLSVFPWKELLFLLSDIL